MATTQTSKNRVYLFRLQTLIIDVGVLVLRNILDQKLNVQNISLSVCLSQERSTILRLKGQTIITQAQYDLLYPPGGKPPSTADFNITLIICLLRNLKACGLNRKFNWNIVPNAMDVSVEADIYRLKMYRNEISHISRTTEIELTYFRFKWTEIEKILLRLNASVINPVPSLQQTIEDLKINPLDEEAEERIQKEVEQWRKLEKGVEVNLRRANLDTQAIKEEMKQQQTGVQQIAKKVDEIDKRTSEYTALIELFKDTQNKVADLEKQMTKTYDIKHKQKEQKELDTSEAEYLKQPMIHGGVGAAHFNSILSTLGLPAVSPKTLKIRERAIGPVIELVAKKSCMDFSKQERNLTSNEISETGDHDTQLTFDQALAFLKNNCEENENHSDDSQDNRMTISSIPKRVTDKLTQEISHRLIQEAKDITGQQADAAETLSCVETLLDKLRDIMVHETSLGFSASGEKDKEGYNPYMRETTQLFRELLEQNVLRSVEEYSDSGLPDSVSTTSTQLRDDGLSLVEENDTLKTSDCLTKIEEEHAGDTFKSKGSSEEGLLHAVDDTEMSKGLGEKGLLNSIELNKLCTSEGRTSSNVEKECDKICSAIKAESDQIVHVLPAYKLNDDDTIVFVVFVERKITLDLPWTLEVRVVHQYSDESRIAMYSKENSPLSMETSRRIGDTIDKYSVKLMRNHTYLSAISASSVVSKHYGTTTNHSIVPGPCIVLSVLVKHFIPRNEEPFPTMLEEIPVDVREGGVRLCGGSADNFHDQVRMGCKITSSLLPDKFGTLGGFVEHPEYGLCGFTCAHAILSDELKNELKDKVNVKGKQICEMFQPSSVSENKIGRVVELTYIEGNGGKTGVDLALFKIEQRPPTEGNFPDNERTTTIKFESGRVWGKEGIPIPPPLVQKFGCVTGSTYGQIQFDGAVVREIQFHSKMETNTLSLTTTLYKQYHIKSNDKNFKFSDLGDSGALVFMSDDFDKENDLRCIGMVEGIWDNHTSCAVTPITAILEELKVTQLKSFAPIITWKTIDARFREMEERMKGMEERVMKAIAKGNTNVQNTS